MSKKYCSSRRQFIIAAGGVAATAGTGMWFPRKSAAAQPFYRRYNLADPAAKKHLETYERAVTEMLALPPEHPHNWYRYALIHTLDCPHGNWWFMPWHRGYIGWLEQICRQVTGDATFALPYWDWTESPRLPDTFLKGNLNPANFSIKGYDEFKAKFDAPLKALYAGFTPAQQKQLTLREFPTLDSLWKSIAHDPPIDTTAESMFSDIAFVRRVNPPNQTDFDPDTTKAVDISTLLDALGPRSFEDFGSHKAAFHSQSAPAGSAVLESQPHNLVHNYVGGFMSGPPKRQGFMRDFLSPVDPIFFMHHSNTDRLWDVWTRKQTAFGNPNNYPIAPTGLDLKPWNDESFLFFVGPDGKPVTQDTSGKYTSTTFFDYDYQPGSGEIIVPRVVPPTHALAGKTFSAIPLKTNAAFSGPATAATNLPEELLNVTGQPDGLRVVAKITVTMPPVSRDIRLQILVNIPPGTRQVTYNDPSFAGTFQVFGSHAGGESAHAANTISFSVGLTDSIRRLKMANRLKANDNISVSVVPQVPGIAIEPVSIEVKQIVLQSF